MKRKAFVMLTAVLALVASSAIGFQARPYLVQDGLRLHGWLVATAYAATCQDDAQKAQALDAWQAAKRTFARALLPDAVWADAQQRCQVLAVRSQKNLIVNAGENFLVDAWQNTTELENLRFHGMGTSATAAAETDTGCLTELTTQYNPDSTRATGSLAEGASANIFRTVGTNTVDAAVAITEFCLMSQAATGGGTMFSRVVFSTINLASADSLQFTWDLTVESIADAFLLLAVITFLIGLPVPPGVTRRLIVRMGLRTE